MAALAAKLADAVLGQYQAGVPARILHIGQNLLLNAAAAAVIGRDHPACTWLSDDSALGARLSASQVATRFAVSANAQGFDDGHIETLTHPGCVNIGAALGIASLTDVAGRDFLSAFLLGCEMEIRLARAVAPEALAQGWDLNGICGTLSAAMTATLLLGASEESLGNAVGLAASCTLGQLSAVGSVLERYILGKASANAVSCALLSQRGFTASIRALDDPRGLGASLVQRPDVFSSVTDTFGTDWLLEDLAISRYPCAIFLQPVVDAALMLRAASPEESHGSAPTILCNELAARLGSRPRPANGLEAQASAQYCAETAFREGAVGPEHFTDHYVAAKSAAAADVGLEVNHLLPLQQAEATIRRDCDSAPDRLSTPVHRSGTSGLAADEVPGRARKLLGSQRCQGLADYLIMLTSELAERPDLGRLPAVVTGTVQ